MDYNVLTKRHKRSHLARIRTVVSEFDPALLLVDTGEHKHFETIAEADEHDRIRAVENDRAIKKATSAKARRRLKRYRKALRKGVKSNSPAVFRAARKTRRRVVSHLASLVTSLPYDSWQVTIMADEWEIDAELLTLDFALDVIGKMRKLVFREGWQNLVGGLVLFLDYEHFLPDNRYRFHFHGVAFGVGIEAALRRLNDLPRFKRGRKAAAVQLDELTNPVRQIAYCIKPYCTGREKDKEYPGVKSPKHVPYKEQRRFLSILNDLTYRDIIIQKNVGIANGTFVYKGEL